MRRMTDTELWNKEWFQEYSLKQKVLIRFLFDNCDCAGVWEPNYRMASFIIGEQITIEDILSLNKSKDQVEVLKNGKIFIPSFVRFQNGELSESCRPHLKVIETLKKHGLYERVSKGYPKGIDTLVDIDIEEDKDNKGGVGEKPEPEVIAERIDYSAIKDWWNKQAAKYGLSQVSVLSPQRKTHLKSRIVDAKGVDAFKKAIEESLDGSAFLRGQNDRGWTADFDFFMQQSSFIKAMEGSYAFKDALGANAESEKSTQAEADRRRAEIEEKKAKEEAEAEVFRKAKIEFAKSLGFEKLVDMVRALGNSEYEAKIKEFENRYYGRAA